MLTNMDNVTSLRESKWNVKYQEVWDFIESHHRSPTRHHLEEHLMLNWMKYNRRVFRRNKMAPDKAEKFARLLELAKDNRKVNQYM